MYNYGSSSVRKYFGNRYTTFVRKYFRTKVFILSKVLSYFRTKYFRTKVRKYFRTFVLSYESTFESTKVPSKVRRYESTTLYFPFVHIIVRVHVQQTYFHLGRYNALAGWVA